MLDDTHDIILGADKLQLYLAMEEKEEGSAFKAAGLIKSFEASFFRMSYTVHPAGLPGEAQGKSSNESWAAKQATRDYPEDWIKRNVVITVMDGTPGVPRSRSC